MSMKNSMSKKARIYNAEKTPAMFHASDAFVRGFRYSLATVVLSLAETITGKSFLPGPSRQARQYWLKSLKFQASRRGNVLKPDVNTLYTLLSRDVIPFTRSVNCAILRL